MKQTLNIAAIYSNSMWSEISVWTCWDITQSYNKSKESDVLSLGTKVADYGSHIMYVLFLCA
jgi:hypothetical protein